jgi:SAM-dependent methyltransferase
VVPTTAAYEVPQSFVTEYTETWRRVHDAKYEPEPADPTWDTGVWIDSYRAQPIPPDDMQEWTSETVGRILRLQPRRILEIGCGSGLLLYRLAPHCGQYVGLDFSQRVIDRLSADIGRRADLRHVKVFHREAQALDDFFEGGFDLVVLNSVVMYLPTAAYLEAVLDRALRTLGPVGRLFIGDVRDRSSQELFHLTVALAGTPGDANSEQLKAAAARSLLIEKQLLLAPSFFTRFASRHPQISGVRIDLKQGAARNEMNRFRFDATLSIGRALALDTAIDTVDGMDLNLSQIQELLIGDPARRLKICMLHNARLASEAALESQLASGATGTVGELVSRSASGGVDPSAVAATAAQAGFEICLQPSESLDPARFSAIFWPTNATESRAVWQFSDNATQSNVRDEMNGQFRLKLERNLLGTLKSLLGVPSGQSAPIEIKVVHEIEQTRHHDSGSSKTV